LNFSIDSVFFRPKEDGDELRKKIERSLLNCSRRELRIVCALIDAMLKREDDDPGDA